MHKLRTSLRYVDTHFHLDLFPDCVRVLKEIEDAGIYTIAVTNTPSVFRHTAHLTGGARYVRAALGLHPELAVEREYELPLIEQLLAETRYVGEIGLDYVTREATDREAQRRILHAILDRCAALGDRVLTVHSRRAAADVVDMIGGRFPGSVILHWFSGSPPILNRAVTYGCYFSVNPAMLSSAAGIRTIQGIPPDRVVTETDGPFVTVEQRPARPSDVSGVVSNLARLWEIATEEAAERIFMNFRRLLTLPNPDHGPDVA
jgi:TatD DNase family protein